MGSKKLVDHYAILGIARDATPHEIKRAWSKLQTKFHPDKHHGVSEDLLKLAEEKLKEINAAKEVLLDPEKRAELDQLLQESDRDSAPAKPEFVPKLIDFGRVKAGETRRLRLDIQNLGGPPLSRPELDSSADSTWFNVSPPLDSNRFWFGLEVTVTNNANVDGMVAGQKTGWISINVDGATARATVSAFFEQRRDTATSSPIADAGVAPSPPSPLSTNWKMAIGATCLVLFIWAIGSPRKSTAPVITQPSSDSVVRFTVINNDCRARELYFNDQLVTTVQPKTSNDAAVRAGQYTTKVCSTGKWGCGENSFVSWTPGTANYIISPSAECVAADLAAERARAEQADREQQAREQQAREQQARAEQNAQRQAVASERASPESQSNCKVFILNERISSIIGPYQGGCKDGLADGQGSYSLATSTSDGPTQMRINGEFRSGKLNGTATIIGLNDISEGEFRENRVVNLIIRGVDNRGVRYATEFRNGAIFATCRANGQGEQNCTDRDSLLGTR